MRVGSLVKNIEHDYIGVVTGTYGHGRYLIRWVDCDVYCYWSACEVEVLCE